MSDTENHPFSAGEGRGIWCDCESRLELVKQSTDAAWLRRVVVHPHTQKTVRIVADRRLSKLAKEAA